MDRTEDDEFPARPWVALNTTYDVEAWIDSYNRDLQRAIDKRNVAGYGICFGLIHGGDIYMHTDPEGQVLLDVTPEAEWAKPVIAAATGTEPPQTQIWPLPGETLTQLLLGLNSLIATARIVLRHEYRIRKF